MQTGSGGSLQSGSGGASATGGALGTGGGAVAGSSNGTGGEPAAGGAVAGAGRTGTGGSTAMAGRQGSGATGSGGVSTAAGAANGGGTAMAGATNGGMGAAGLPNDPKWKPPDMTATAKIIVLYQAQQTMANASNLGMIFELKNQTSADYDLSKVTLRYWFSSEPPPMPSLDYGATGLNVSKTIQFVPNSANSYLLFTFGKGGICPAYVDMNSLNNARIQAEVQSGIGSQQFNQANDWSFDANASMPIANPKITLYDGDTLIWGCEPSHVCASTDTTGEGGAGGVSGM
jgi:hypothetical protein